MGITNKSLNPGAFPLIVSYTRASKYQIVLIQLAPQQVKCELIKHSLPPDVFKAAFSVVVGGVIKYVAIAESLVITNAGKLPAVNVVDAVPIQSAV